MAWSLTRVQSSSAEDGKRIQRQKRTNVTQLSSRIVILIRLCELTWDPVTPQQCSSLCSRSHSSVKSADMPYSCTKRVLNRVTLWNKWQIEWTIECTEARCEEQRHEVKINWKSNWIDGAKRFWALFFHTHFNIGWISCIILSNLNIHKIPRMASPMSNTNSNNQ